jgi:hypothetical protein
VGSRFFSSQVRLLIVCVRFAIEQLALVSSCSRVLVLACSRGVDVHGCGWSRVPQCQCVVRAGSSTPDGDVCIASARHRLVVGSIAAIADRRGARVLSCSRCVRALSCLLPCVVCCAGTRWGDRGAVRSRRREHAGAEASPRLREAGDPGRRGARARVLLWRERHVRPGVS